MRFSFSVAALALAALSSALPTTPEVTLARRVAGPSGSVITPVGETSYSVGDAIDFVYHRSIEKGSQTDSLNIVLKTFDTLDGVEYSANVITLASYLSYLDIKDQNITAAFRIPELAGPEGQTSWTARLEVVESRIGARNAAPFLAAAPLITIKQASL